MENKDFDPKTINGWGIDADTENDPTYPMKPNRTDEEKEGYTWERPPLQPVDLEILQSNERPGPSAVFGTSVPPSGVSGQLRRQAFKFSEGNLNHWLLLLAADRVNIIEGVVDDLAHGHLPNFIKEGGWAMEWKHNRKGVIKQLAIGGAIAGVAIAALLYKRSGKK